MPAEPTVAVDTSVAVPYLITGHQAHVAVGAKLDGQRPALAGHAHFETYAVLTSLPAGMRHSPSDALRLIDAAFSATVFPKPGTAGRLVAAVAAAGLIGGAIYDALVGAAAADASLPLLTRDVRARATYEAVGATPRLIG